MNDIGTPITEFPLLSTVTAPTFVPAVSAGVTYKVLLYPVTQDRIASGAVTSANIASKTITGANIADYSITANLLDPNVLNGFTIGPGSIGTTQLAYGSVTGAKIAAGTITNDNLATGTLLGTSIAAGTVTNSNIATGTVLGSNIAAATITTSNLAAGAVTSTNLASSSVGTTAIQAGAVTGTKIASATVTTDKLDPSFYSDLATSLASNSTFLSAIVASAPFAGLTSLNTLYGAVTLKSNGGNNTSYAASGSNIVQSVSAAPVAVKCYVNASTGSDSGTKTISSNIVSGGFATITGALAWLEANCARNCNVTIIVQTNVSQGTITCRYFNQITITNDPNAPTVFPVVSISNYSTNNPSGVVDTYAVSVQTPVRIEAVDFNINTWTTGVVNLFVVNQGQTLQHGASIVTIPNVNTFGDFYTVYGSLILANTGLTARTFSVQASITPAGTNFIDAKPDARVYLGDASGLTSNSNQVLRLGSAATFTTWLYLYRGAEYAQNSTLAVATAVSQSGIVGARAYLDAFSRSINVGGYSAGNAQMFGASTGAQVTQISPNLIDSTQLSVWGSTQALNTY